MGGGLVQLVAYGIQDVVLIGDPQITLFKTLYRRYSNFSLEPVPQSFNKQSVTLGQTVHCKLGRTGDMVYRVSLVATLPPIAQFITNGVPDPRTRFAWARRIGFAMISRVTVQIGGIVVDSQTGDFMNIWHELTHPHDNNMRRLIGDIPELTDWTNGKSAYTVRIPLSFWFNRNNALALPIVALQHTQVQIDVEFANPEQCYTISPLNMIQLLDDTVQFHQYEYIEQNVNGVTARAQFVDFDPVTRTMWYNRMSDEPLRALSVAPLDARTRQRYAIVGLESTYSAVPLDGTKEKVVRRAPPPVVLTNCHLDVEYVYLDADERARIGEMAKEYLIEQVQLAASRSVQSSIASLKLALNHPIKSILVVVRTQTATNSNDWFNYTTSPYRERGTDALLGRNPIVSAELLFNGKSRTGMKPGFYYDRVHPVTYFPCTPMRGVNVFSMALLPGEHFPSGAANCTMIDNIELKLTLDSSISSNNQARIQVYGVGYNVLRTVDGFGGVLFSN
jgi:hypothetical protein